MQGHRHCKSIKKSVLEASGKTYPFLISTVTMTIVKTIIKKKT